MVHAALVTALRNMCAGRDPFRPDPRAFPGWRRTARDGTSQSTLTKCSSSRAADWQSAGPQHAALTLPSAEDGSNASVVAMAADSLEGFERFLVCQRQRVQVLLSGLDLAVAKSIHDRLQVRSSREKP